MSIISGIAAAADIASSMVNYKHQKEKFKYEKGVQQTTWDREDNATQRRVADLRAAGLSPTLAAGSAAQTSNPISTTTPQISENIGSSMMAKKNMAADLMTKSQNIATSKAQEKYLNMQAKGQEIKNRIQGGTEEQQIATATSRASIQAVNAWKAKISKNEYNNLMLYVNTNSPGEKIYDPWTGSYQNTNKQVQEYKAMQLSLQLQRHDTEGYMATPLPSGSLNSAISGMSGVLGKIMR